MIRVKAYDAQQHEHRTLQDIAESPMITTIYHVYIKHIKHRLTKNSVFSLFIDAPLRCTVRDSYVGK